ncbi:MAG: hypothetical protein FWD14_02660 [Treponema sp.]|nr:hypothetical protein [Treponema sp.]
MNNEKETIIKIVGLLKDNGLTIRGYEGEVCGCVIERESKEIAFVENETMDIKWVI